MDFPKKTFVLKDAITAVTFLHVLAKRLKKAVIASYENWAGANTLMFGWLVIKSKSLLVFSPSILSWRSNIRCKSRNERFVSLKILTCEATKALESNSDELGLLRTIATSNPSHRGFRYNLAYYDTFRFKGPHGEHQCVATEVLGFSLDYVRKLRDDHSVQPSTVRRVTKQLLMGLEYLHNECQIIHAGVSFSSVNTSNINLSPLFLCIDIKHDNILFRPKALESVIAQELINSPSVCYDCGTEICPPVVPVVSQALPPTNDKVIPEAQLEAVLADVGHCTYLFHVLTISRQTQIVER